MSDMKIPELGAASLARRYYNHVLNGGTLSAAAPTDNTALVDEMENLRDRNGKPPLTKEEMARFRELFPLDYLSRVALAAWVNVRPDQLPKEMQAHNCPATMEAWGRVAEAIRAALRALEERS